MKIENAKVTINVDDPNELIEAMDTEEKLEFFQSLSCHNEVIEYVMQQVFEGFTDNGSHGSISCAWNGSTPLQVFRKKLIEVGAYRATKDRIKGLERCIEQAEERIDSLISRIDELTYGRGEK